MSNTDDRRDYFRRELAAVEARVRPDWLRRTLEHQGDPDALLAAGMTPVAAVDVRPSGVTGTLPGAIRLPLTLLSARWHVAMHAQLVPPSALLAAERERRFAVVLVGSDTPCREAAEAALLLFDAGFRDVRELDGGVRRWREWGLPMADGEPVALTVTPAAERVPVHGPERLPLLGL